MEHESAEHEHAIIVTGHSVGQKIGQGKARIINSPREMQKMQPGCVLVGAVNATTLIHDGEEITVSCADSQVGKVYRGLLPFKVEKIAVNAMPPLPFKFYVERLREGISTIEAKIKLPLVIVSWIDK